MTQEDDKTHIERVVNRLFDEIEDTQRKVSALSRAQDTRHTMIMPGGTFEVLREDGTKLSLGDNESGKLLEHVGGPTPERPEAPEVSTQEGALTVVVDGIDVHGDPAPVDLKHTRIHYSREAEFVPYMGTTKGVIPGASGQKVFSLSAGLWYVAVQWETESGKLSEPSEIVSVDLDPPVNAQDIQDTLDEAQERIDAARAEAEPRFEYLETGLGQNEQNIADAEQRIQSAEDLIRPLPGRIEQAEADVETARDEAAADATAKADKARDDAIAAAEADATQKANQAKADAAADAQAKADQARADAEATAAEHADLVAGGASAEAIAEAERLHGLAMAKAEKAEQDAAAAHTAAGGAQSTADAAMDRAGAAETNAIAEAERLADAARAVADEAKAQNRVYDTRDDNEPPSYYYALHRADRVKSVTEFKRRATIDLTQATGSYVHLTTYMSWTDASGGPIRQEAIDNNHEVWTRVSLSVDTWGPWRNRVADATEDAKDHADNLPKVLHGTTAPSGTAPDGSIWWQHSGGLGGPVIGQWNRVNGAWQSTPIDSEAIANLDVGKLTAGSAEIAQAFVQKLMVDWGLFNFLEAIEGWIGGVALKDGAVTAGKITVTDKLITDLFGANRALINEELVVKGRLIADNADLINAAMQNLSVTERADFVEAFAQQIYSRESITEVLLAGAAWIGGAQIKDNAIDVENLNVTGEMVGAIASFLHLVTDKMELNELWGDSAWLTAVEASNVRLRSSVNGWETLLSGRGMEVISPEGQPSTQLGNFEETGLTLYRDGEANASVTDDGSISGSVVSANDEFYYQGTELSEILNSDSTPRGAVAYAQRDMSGNDYPSPTHLGFLELSFDAEAGRQYQLLVEPFRVREVEFQRIVITYDGEAPTISMGSDTSSRQVYTNRIPDQVGGGTFRIRPVESDSLVRILVGVYGSLSGIRFPNVTGNVVMTISDIGTPPENTGVNRGSTIVPGGSGDPDVKPPVTKTRRTKTYSMSWWRTWWQDGNIPSYGVGVKEAAQGRSPHFTTAGTYRSMIGFPSMTSDLSGADIEKIEVRVRVTHTHSGSGGRVRLGTHSNSSRPSSFTGHGNNNELTNTHFGRGQEKWVTLPSSTHAGFKNGSLRGVTLFTSSTSSTYYVQARPSRFAIRVTYRK